MNAYGELASGIVTTEFSYLTGAEQTAEISYVSGWLEANIGKLNVLIHSDFSGVDPDLEAEENAIFAQLYMYNYYNKRNRDILRGADASSLEWTRITEGDSTVVRSSKVEIAREMRAAAEMAKQEIDALVVKYNNYQAEPRQVRMGDAGRVYSETDKS